MKETSATEEKPSLLSTPMDCQQNSCRGVPTPLTKTVGFGTILQIDGNDDVDSETDADEEKQEGQPQYTDQGRERAKKGTLC